MKDNVVQWRLTGRHALAMIIGFFAVIMIANGAFVYFALGTWTGLDTPDPYARGLRYNDILDEAAAQRSRGWRASAEAVRTADGETVVVMAYEDADGTPVSGLAVSAELRRPAQAKDDRAVDLSADGAGRYRGVVNLPRAGQWDLRVTALQEGKTVYRLEQRLWLK